MAPKPRSLKVQTDKSAQRPMAHSREKAHEPMAVNRGISTRSANGVIKRTEKGVIQQNEIERSKQHRQVRQNRRIQRQQEVEKENYELGEQTKVPKPHSKSIPRSHRRTDQQSLEVELTNEDENNENEVTGNDGDARDSEDDDNSDSSNAFQTSDDERPENIRARQYTIPEKITFHHTVEANARPTLRITQPKSAFSGRKAASSPVAIRTSKPALNTQRRVFSSPLSARPRERQCRTPSSPSASHGYDDRASRNGTSEPDTNQRRKHPRDEDDVVASNHNSHPESSACNTNDSDNPELTDDNDIERRPKKPKKPRLYDLRGSEKDIVDKAIEEFQIRVCTEYAFPESKPSELRSMVMECWDNACERYQTDLPLTKEARRLITSRVSTIRGRIKEKVVAKLAGKYGLLESPDEADINTNKDLVQKLLQDYSYIYKDPENLRGMYEHPIVADVIAHQFFQKRARSEGIVYSGLFNPIPEPLIALVFTVVHFAIIQWEDGTFTAGGSFKAAQYQDIYMRHLNGLKKWREYNANTAKALARYQQRLYEYGSQRAGFKARANTPPGDPFAQDRLAAAAASLEDEL